MSKIAIDQAFDLITLSKAENKVGDVKESTLTPEDFFAEHLGHWMLMNGQSCIGTLYHAITGNANLPDMVTEGAFLRQAKPSRIPGSYEEDQVKSHGHESIAFSKRGYPDGSGDRTSNYYFMHSLRGSDFSLYINPNGGPETRPKNVAVNFFVKVGY